MDNHNFLNEPMIGGKSYFKPLRQSEDISDARVFEPFKSPPDFDMAINHGKAKRVYKSQSLDIGTSICPCCGLPVSGELIPVCCELYNLYPLGSGYVLYFRLLKYSIWLLGLLFLTSGLFNTITSGLNNGCSQKDGSNGSEYCIQDLIVTFTIANKRTSFDLLEIQMILNMLTVFMIIIFFQYIYYKVRKTIAETDEQTITPSDYTIMVNGIEPTTEDSEIIKWVESLGDAKNLIKCTKINRAYDIKEYVDFQKNKAKLHARWKTEEDYRVRHSIVQEIMLIDEQLQTYKEKDFNLAPTVFISLDKQQQIDYVVNKFNRIFVSRWFYNFRNNLSESGKHFHGHKVNIKRAPEPTDVIWENQGYDPNKKLRRRIISEVSSVLLITICFIIVAFISYGSTRVAMHVEQRSFLISFLSGVAGILIYTVNTLLAMAAHYLSKREEHKTYTAYFTGVTKRLSVSMFINTAFTTLFAQLLTILIIGQDDEAGTFNFYKQGGLLENIFYVFLSNAILTPLYTVLDPFYMWKRFQRKKALEAGVNCKLTQQSAHVLFEQPDMDLSFRNAFLVKTILASSFFAPAVPLAVVVSILGLICNYWTDKYSLLQRNVLPTSLNHTLNDKTVQLLRWMSFMFAIGNLVFIITLRDDVEDRIYDSMPKALIFIPIAFGILQIFLPMEKLNRFLFSVPNENSNHLSYDDARVHFPTDYEIENPITCRDGLHNFIRTIKRKDLSSDNRMNDSIKMGAFNVLRDSNLKEFITEDFNEESAQIKKERDLAFLDCYVSQVRDRQFKTRQKFEREKGVDLNLVLETWGRGSLELSPSKSKNN